MPVCIKIIYVSMPLCACVWERERECLFILSMWVCACKLVENVLKMQEKNWDLENYEIISILLAD